MEGSMLDIIDSKAGMLAVIWSFCLAISYLGLLDLSRNSVHLSQLDSLNAQYQADRMVEILHGDVNLGAQADTRRRQRDRAAQERAESYDGFRRYMGSLMP
jgi:hypothetical protein